MKIRRGDKVKILSGKDKGKSGEVLKIDKINSLAIVSGVNIVKKHIKNREGVKGGINELEKPIPVSRLAIICPKCQKLTRVGFILDSKTKKRVCKKCKGVLS